MGFRLKPHIQSFVTISPNVHFECDPAFDAHQVIRYDRLLKEIEDAPAKFNVLGLLSSFVSYETLEEIGQTLIRHHKPATIDWRRKLRLGAEQTEASFQPGPAKVKKPTTEIDAKLPAIPSPAEKVTNFRNTCKSCGSTNLTMKYGHSYYFNCSDCSKNTTPTLPGPGKIREEGQNFYFVGADANEILYHTNAS